MGAAGLLAAGTTASALAAAADGGSSKAHGAQLFSSDKLLGPGQLPEAKVETSDGRTVRFYADLIKDKVVVINYMAIDNERAFPIIAELLEITRHLKLKLGTDLHIVSITSDPVRDTPVRLRAFTKRMGIPKQGWHFVRMSGESSAIVSARLYRHPMPPDPRTRIGVISYGNEAVGLWGLFPMGISPKDAAMRITSVTNGVPVNGPTRKAGPRKLEEAGLAFNSRIA
ncbi:hypothetical protein UUC_12661 [Rhodanobacter denitrificans]|nr:hypothetical protein UUC_12661 [Rhodanobacter denitrificans]